eukprot:1720737-Rhodomonas_salina.2
MSGSDIGYAATRFCIFLIPAPLSGILLRAPYAISGTDCSYRATRRAARAQYHHASHLRHGTITTPRVLRRIWY